MRVDMIIGRRTLQGSRQPASPALTPIPGVTLIQFLLGSETRPHGLARRHLVVVLVIDAGAVVPVQLRDGTVVLHGVVTEQVLSLIVRAKASLGEWVNALGRARRLVGRGTRGLVFVVPVRL